MESLRCGNCSLLNFATASACKRCGLPFNSEDQAVSDSDAVAPIQAYQPSPEGGSYFWDQPSYPQGYAPLPAPKSSGTSALAKIMIGVAVICIVSFVAIPRLLKKSKTDFVNVSWNEFRSPDQKFSVSLPATHKTSERVVPTPFGNAKATMLEAEISKEGGCMLMYADYPIERLNMSEDDLYEMAIKGAASRQTTMAIGARRYITVDGFRGVEAELRPTNSTLSAKGGLRIFWVAPRLYVLGAGGPDTPEFQALQKKFFESFHLSRGL